MIGRVAIVLVTIAHVVTTGCAHGPRPTIAGNELYARLDRLVSHGRVELVGSNNKPVVVKTGQILVTEDARQMFALDMLVSTCTGRPAEEPETCTLAMYRNQRFRVFDDPPIHLAGTAQEEPETSDAAKILIVVGAIALPLSYGIASCEFDGCKTVFGIALGADLFLGLIMLYGMG